MDINKYMNKSMENLIGKMLKISVKNSKELLYLGKFLKSFRKGVKLRKENEKTGEHIPYFIMASITLSCNLHCKGCYFKENMKCNNSKENGILTTKRWKEIFSETRDAGINFVILLGGEPLMRKDVIEEAAKVKEIMFPIFTNGTLIDDEYTKIFKENRNLFPMISIEGKEDSTNFRRGEGVYKKIDNSMSLLFDNNILYGASITVTKENILEVTSEDFLDELIIKGCVAIVYVEYVDADLKSENKVLNDLEREYLKKRVDEIRDGSKNIVVISFPGDEEKIGGCLAAGRGFFHINANGGCEPCPFSPMSDMNLKNSTVKEVLKSPFFKKICDEELLFESHKGGCLLWEKRQEVEVLYKK